jgi:hypothetical protein
MMSSVSMAAPKKKSATKDERQVELEAARKEAKESKSDAETARKEAEESDKKLAESEKLRETAEESLTRSEQEIENQKNAEKARKEGFGTRTGVEYSAEAGVGVRSVSGVGGNGIASTDVELKPKASIGTPNYNITARAGGIAGVKSDSGAAAVGNQVKSASGYVGLDGDVIVHVKNFYAGAGATHLWLLSDDLQASAFRGVLGACGGLEKSKIDICVEGLAAKWNFNNGGKGTELGLSLDACKKFESNAYALCLGAAYSNFAMDERTQHNIDLNARLQREINDSTNAYVKLDFQHDFSTGSDIGPTSNALMLKVGIQGDLNSDAIKTSKRLARTRHQ